jgi:hypothetical protein
MTDSAQITPPVEAKPTEKELNFRALEAKYQRQLEQERAARLEAERKIQEAMQRNVQEEDDDSEPYVDVKKLEKKLAKFGEQTKQSTQQEIKQAVQAALQEERQSNWVRQNSDFYDVMQHADKLAALHPDLAENILEMPDTFARKQLVYKNIKALGLHQAPQKQPSIQEKIDSNRRSAYYQPTGVAASPYAQAGDFSSSGQESAYKKMMDLKARMRI